MEELEREIEALEYRELQLENDLCLANQYIDKLEIENMNLESEVEALEEKIIELQEYIVNIEMTKAYEDYPQNTDDIYNNLRKEPTIEALLRTLDEQD